MRFAAISAKQTHTDASAKKGRFAIGEAEDRQGPGRRAALAAIPSVRFLR